MNKINIFIESCECIFEKQSKIEGLPLEEELKVKFIFDWREVESINEYVNEDGDNFFIDKDCSVIRFKSKFDLIVRIPFEKAFKRFIETKSLNINYN